MLPQMMPTPWIIIYTSIFFCYMSITLFTGKLSLNFAYLPKESKSTVLPMPW